MPQLPRDIRQANWNAICDGRDLLKEIADLKAATLQVVETELRKAIAATVCNVILNPREYGRLPSDDS